VLPVEELDQLATVAYLVGREDDAAEVWERAHRDAVDRGDPTSAAR
jgi:hypothetical protein